jgi:serine/threonine-protein kinase
VPNPAVIRLQLFGAPSVQAIGGREAAAVHAQPKRLALLAYLAIAAPYGFHRRDTILSLFWPEAGKDRARTALRQAIHFLRHELSPELIASRGDEELGLAENRVWCDVREFDRMLRSGHVPEALALYRGDLLPGFYIPDAPEFERWLEAERLRLHRQAAEAAWTHVDRLERERDADGAARWARWASALTPDDDRATRRLIALLGRIGDRAGAIRAYEGLAVRLKREYGVPPSRETEELIHAIRAGRADAATGGATPQGARAPPPPAPEADDAPAPRMISREYIAVFPFPVHGDGSAAYLHEGLVDLLSTNLDHAGTLHSIDPQALLSRLDSESGARLDPARAAELAEAFGAHHYVLGSIVGVAGRLRDRKWGV